MIHKNDLLSFCGSHFLNCKHVPLLKQGKKEPPLQAYQVNLKEESFVKAQMRKKINVSYNKL
jgi:hypothetical protein